MSIKLSYFKTFPLCVLCICAATLITFSQTNDTPATQAAVENVMPIARTLTSADGRTIDVTIVSKSETAIKAKRADSKEFEIALDKLSDADKAFVAGLTDGPGKAAPGKKASVLYVIDWSNPEEYEKYDKEQVAWLKASGFDVTIGLKYYVKTKFPEIADEKVSWLNPIAMMDSYDIVWLQRFERSKANKAEPTEYDFYQLTNHRNKQGGVTVFRTNKTSKDDFLVYTPTPLTRRPGYDKGSFVTNEGDWVFFWDTEKEERTPKEKIRRKLLEEIEELLAKKKK